MLLLIVGLVGLWISTNWIINGAFGIAKRFNLSHSFVGVAILAIGTDLPEVFVSVNASILHLNGIESSGIITGNAIGSSIIQITFIIGLAALFQNLLMIRKDLWRDGIALLTSVILLFAFGIDGIISRLDGLILLIIYGFYYFGLLKSKKVGIENDIDGKDYSNYKLTFFLIIGFTLLIFSSHLVVQNAMLLSKRWGVTQSFIGILIIGIGTSLPELAVSLGAVLRKSQGMSIGNIIGSNIFDGFIPIGIGALISTTNFESSLLKFDLPFLLAVTILVLKFLNSSKGISKLNGLLLISIFLIYITLKVFIFVNR